MNEADKAIAELSESYNDGDGGIGHETHRLTILALQEKAEREDNEPNKLSDIIQEAEQVDNIKQAFFCRNYEDGGVEIHIEFKDHNLAEDMLKKYKDKVIPELNICAYWE